MPLNFYSGCKASSRPAHLLRGLLSAYALSGALLSHGVLPLQQVLILSGHSEAVAPQPFRTRPDTEAPTNSKEDPTSSGAGCKGCA
mmetsp:Transcript_9112/g.12370  ORF Transcript_9112/g.12370 Transcript_9112/m.12370 type:complete len:86 (-) Transcript_9112:106-363(-)